MTAIEHVSLRRSKRMFDLQGKGGESIGRYLTPFAYISIFAATYSSYFRRNCFILVPVSYHGVTDIVVILFNILWLSILWKVEWQQLIFMKKHILLQY